MTAGGSFDMDIGSSRACCRELGSCPWGQAASGSSRIERRTPWDS